MNPYQRIRLSARLALLLATPLLVAASLAATNGPPATDEPPPATYAELPSDTPEAFEPLTTSFDYTRREEMIPMRDGVKLNTVILVPKGARNAPILLPRWLSGFGAETFPKAIR